MSEIDEIAMAFYNEKWLLGMAMAVGLLVRLMKDERLASIPVLGDLLGKIPSKARPALALALGCLSGVLDSAVNGTPWPQAIISGTISGALAVAGHEAIIEGMFGGREVFSARK